MPVPTFVAAGTVGAGTGDVVPGLPAGWAANDFHLLPCETVTETPATPDGWTLIASVGSGIGDTRLTGFWRRAVDGDVAPTIVDPGDHCLTQILGFRGVFLTGTPFDGTNGSGGSSTSFITGGFTTTQPDCLVIVVGAISTDTTTPQFSAWANADLVNVTERSNIVTDAGNGGGLGVMSGERAAAGAITNTTATLAIASTRAWMIVSLFPAAEPYAIRSHASVRAGR